MKIGKRARVESAQLQTCENQTHANGEAPFADAHFKASFTHFAGALPVLAFGAAIATLPTFAAYSYARIARLTVSPVPIYVPAFRIFMLWNVKRNADVHNQWPSGAMCCAVFQRARACPQQDIQKPIGVASSSSVLR